MQSFWTDHVSLPHCHQQVEKYCLPTTNSLPPSCYLWVKTESLQRQGYLITNAVGFRPIQPISQMRIRYVNVTEWP